MNSKASIKTILFLLGISFLGSPVFAQQGLIDEFLQEQVEDQKEDIQDQIGEGLDEKGREGEENLGNEGEKFKEGFVDRLKDRDGQILDTSRNEIDLIIRERIENTEDKNRFIGSFIDLFNSSENDSLQSRMKQEGSAVRNMVRDGIVDRFDQFDIIPPDDLDTSQYTNFRKISADQNVNIFGWHPYWMGNAHTAYNFELLTHVSYFSYDLNPETGGYRNFGAIESWKNTDLVEMAHEKNCKVLLTISNHGFKNNELFFSSRFPIRQRAIDSLIALVEFKGADGVDINFENIPAAYKKEFTLFVIDLGTQLRKKNKEYFLNLTIPSYDWGKIYDFEVLNEHVDLYVIMGYDFHTRLSKTDGPIAPLNRNPNSKQKDLAQAVRNYQNRGAPRSDLVLAMPYYGGLWQTVNSNPVFLRHMTYREIKTRFGEFIGQSNFDPATNSMHLIIADSSAYAASEGQIPHQDLWFDNEYSLGLKYDWVIDQELGGVGIWALGYDNGYDELWALIDEKFTVVEVPEVNRISTSVLNAIRRYSNLVVTGLVFIVVFMSFGFLFSLYDWRVRDAFFSSNYYRLIYIGFFFFILMVALILIGFLPTLWVMIVGAVLSGLVVMSLVTYLVARRRARLP